MSCPAPLPQGDALSLASQVSSVPLPFTEFSFIPQTWLWVHDTEQPAGAPGLPGHGNGLIGRQRTHRGQMVVASVSLPRKVLDGGRSLGQASPKAWNKTDRYLFTHELPLEEHLCPEPTLHHRSCGVPLWDHPRVGDWPQLQASALSLSPLS